MKEILITNNNPGEETDPYEEMDEQIINKNTSGNFLYLNYKKLPTPYIVLKFLKIYFIIQTKHAQNWFLFFSSKL